MNNYDYPQGADTSSAPWRQEENKPRKIKVTVSQTLSTTLEIEVDDYNVDTGWDEDCGYYPIYDYSECDLHSAVKSQYIMPNKAVTPFNGGIIWDEDDFEVILEE